jgi:hypothetical protein
MIISSEIEAQPWALKPSIKLVIARFKVIKLDPLSKKLTLDIVCQRD